MSKIKIEKNIPAPQNDGRGREAIYPWREMDIGDSFLVKASNGNRRAKIQNISVCASSFGKRNPGFKFKCRTVDKGVRVWRVPATQ